MIAIRVNDSFTRIAISELHEFSWRNSSPRRLRLSFATQNALKTHLQQCRNLKIFRRVFLLNLKIGNEGESIVDKSFDVDLWWRILLMETKSFTRNHISCSKNVLKFTYSKVAFQTKNSGGVPPDPPRPRLTRQGRERLTRKGREGEVVPPTSNSWLRHWYHLPSYLMERWNNAVVFLPPRESL